MDTLLFPGDIMYNPLLSLAFINNSIPSQSNCNCFNNFHLRPSKLFLIYFTPKVKYRLPASPFGVNPCIKPINFPV